MRSLVNLCTLRNIVYFNPQVFNRGQLEIVTVEFVFPLLGGKIIMLNGYMYELTLHDEISFRLLEKLLYLLLVVNE